MFLSYILAYRYVIGKVASIGLFLYSWITLKANAAATRAWYHNNWCGETPTMRPRLTSLQGEPSECLYWVGSDYDYMFLTSSAFHDGFTLHHVGLIGAILLFIITYQLEIVNELQIRNWYETHSQQEVTEE